MKIKLVQNCGIIAVGCLALLPGTLLAQEKKTQPTGYIQQNLVSDVVSNAAQLDPLLVNPWGIVAGEKTVWVNDNGTGLTTAYGPLGKTNAFAIHVPAPGGGAGAPSGLVFNDTGKFVISNATKHAASTFLIATENGTIVAWNQKITGSNGVIVVDNSNSGAVYKGLAIARDTNGTPHLYAANFHAGVVDVFDTNFHYEHSFTDGELPDGYAPFNVRRIHGQLFVAFALQKLPELKDDQAGPGNGYVDIFDKDGTLLRRFASGGALNSPWGMAYAPARFGKFSNSLLIGNFGDGTINSYNILTGKFLGTLSDPAGNPIVIPGLWGLTFEREPKEDHECDFAAARLYFTAGINDEADGLFGVIHSASHNSQ